MSIILSCPSCNRKLKAKDEQAGRRMKCPACMKIISVSIEDDTKKNDSLSKGQEMINMQRVFSVKDENKGYVNWIVLGIIAILLYVIGNATLFIAGSLIIVNVFLWIKRKERIEAARKKVVEYGEKAGKAEEKAKEMQKRAEVLAADVDMPSLALDVAASAKRACSAAARAKEAVQAALKERGEVGVMLATQKAFDATEDAVYSADIAEEELKKSETRAPEEKKYKEIVKAAQSEIADLVERAEEIAKKSVASRKEAESIAEEAETPSLAADTIACAEKVAKAVIEIQRASQSARIVEDGFKVLLEVKNASAAFAEVEKNTIEAEEAKSVAEARAPDAKKAVEANKIRLREARSKAMASAEKAELAAKRAEAAKITAEAVAEDAETPDLAADTKTSAQSARECADKAQRAAKITTETNDGIKAEEEAEKAGDAAIETEGFADAAEAAMRISETLAPEAKKAAEANKEKVKAARNDASASSEKSEKFVEIAENARKKAEAIADDSETPDLSTDTTAFAQRAKNAADKAKSSAELAMAESDGVRAEEYAKNSAMAALEAESAAISAESALKIAEAKAPEAKKTAIANKVIKKAREDAESFAKKAEDAAKQAAQERDAAEAIADESALPGLADDCITVATNANNAFTLAKNAAHAASEESDPSKIMDYVQRAHDAASKAINFADVAKHLRKMIEESALGEKLRRALRYIKGEEIERDLDKAVGLLRELSKKTSLQRFQDAEKCITMLELSIFGRYTEDRTFIMEWLEDIEKPIDIQNSSTWRVRVEPLNGFAYHVENGLDFKSIYENLTLRCKGTKNVHEIALEMRFDVLRGVLKALRNSMKEWPSFVTEETWLSLRRHLD